MAENLKILTLVLGIVTAVLIGKVADTKQVELSQNKEEYLIEETTEENISTDNTDVSEKIVIEVEADDTDKISIYKQVINEVRGSLAESYMDNAVDIAADALENLFGIREDMYESFYGQQSNLESSVDIFLILESTQKDKEEVKNLLNDYVIKITNNASQRDMIKFKQSKISEYNNYLILSVIGAKSVSEYASTEEAEKAYSEFNTKAAEIALNVLKNKLYQTSEAEALQAANIVDDLSSNKSRKSIIIDVGPVDR